MADHASPIQNRNGRPRDSACTDRITSVALDVLAEVGYDRLTMDAIAERAQTSKATLYRRWATKESLVAEAVRQLCPGESHADEPLPLRERTTERLVNLFGVDDPRWQGVLVGLSSALCRHPELATAIRDGVVDQHEPGSDDEYFADIAPALLFYRLVFHGEPVTRASIERVVDRLFSPHMSNTATSGLLKGM